jgi:hypothetical protein
MALTTCAILYLFYLGWAKRVVLGSIAFGRRHIKKNTTGIQDYLYHVLHQPASKSKCIILENPQGEIEDAFSESQNLDTLRKWWTTSLPKLSQLNVSWKEITGLHLLLRTLHHDISE